MSIVVEQVELGSDVIVIFKTDLTPGNITTDSTIWKCPLGVSNVRYLVVAGGGPGLSSNGGSGKACGGGGGGAGGVLTGYLDVTPDVEYEINVGRGGLGVPATPDSSKNGSNSKFHTIIAIGGGVAGGGVKCIANSGGSGGGCTSTITEYFSGTPGNGTSGQGNAGGSSTVFATSTMYACGTGGGGAGAGGSSPPADTPMSAGDGGIGVESDISGTPTYYGGGGGGGAPYSGTLVRAGVGGLGGGGRGCIVNGTLGASGTSHTGGGGGGTKFTAPTHGGSGIVILRYSLPHILVLERQNYFIGSGNLLISTGI